MRLDAIEDARTFFTFVLVGAAVANGISMHNKSGYLLVIWALLAAAANLWFSFAQWKRKEKLIDEWYEEVLTRTRPIEQHHFP